MFVHFLVKLNDQFLSSDSAAVVSFVLLHITDLNTAVELIDGPIVVLDSGPSEIPSSWAQQNFLPVQVFVL